MKHKISLLLLTLFACVYICQAAIIDGTCGTNLTWVLNTRDSTLVIEGSGTMTNWSTNNSVPWYEYVSYIATVSLSEGITSIGNRAFYNCAKLASIEIPSSITKIGAYSFYGCIRLNTITLPDGVTNIGTSAYGNCSGVTSISIGRGVTSMSSDAFGCSNVVSIEWNAQSCNNFSRTHPPFASSVQTFTFGNNVKKIPSCLCYGMKNLTSIIIPNSVTNIGDSAFFSCSGLTSVNVSDILTWCNISFGGYYANPLSYAKNLYLNMELLANITIPGNVASISNYAFVNCKNLKSITIPNTVTSIGVSAFQHCTSLTSVVIGGATSIKNMTFYNCKNLESIELPNSISSIGKQAFYGCQKLSTLTIPNSVKTIGISAFEECSSLNNVIIPNGVTDINDKTFYRCSNLVHVDIPNSITKIGAEVFYQCKRLSSITIPSKVNSIGENAFYACDSLYVVTLESNVSGSIYGQQVKEYIIGTNVTRIGDNAFRGCNSLHAVSIPHSISYIGNYAFSQSPIQKISINSDKYVGMDYTEVYTQNCFANKIGLDYPIRELILGDSITKIGINAFRYEPLTTITIPKNVTSIGDNAFYNTLTEVVCKATTPPTSKSSSFPNKNIPLYVPEESIELYSNAIWWEEFYQILPIPSGSYTIYTDAINGHVEGAGEYESGTSISLVAIPNEGYIFSHWSDGNTDNPRTIVVSEDATYTAIFRSELSSDDFLFTSYQNGSTIGLSSLASHQVIEYSRNGTTWINMTTATSITLNNGDSVYMRGVLSDNNTSTDYTQFTMTGAIAAYGNINYLWNYANLNAPLKEYCGANLFKDCVGLIYAPELPSTELADYCYIGMFRGCSSLSSAPVLPAMTLTDHGYCSMFRECTSLISAPSLPATTIAASCYTSMFQGCTNLTLAPTILPAQTLADYCYQSMFSGTAISTAPELPATTLAPCCYVSMFQDCASLMSAPSLMAESLTDYCYWRMFRGCTSLTSAPTILPATNLTTYCYNQMFMQTAITSAPELPAKTLGDYSYNQMFYQCSLLNYIKCLATNISATGCTQGWVNGVASSGTFVKNSKMTSWTNGNNGIPTGWTIQNYVVNEYVVNFVDWDGAIIKTEQVISGESATAPADPMREGYTFIGWDRDFSNVTENMTITAFYKIKRYRVEFLDWDNTILKRDSVDWNTSATAPLDPIREGYTFIGWDKDYHNITEDLTVTAQYELGENANFIVIFNTKEGDEILSNDITLKVPAAPEINGFTFLGWRPKATIIDNNVIEIEAIYEANEETSLQEVIINSNNSAQKLIREGNVYILFDNKTYTLQGQEVR